MQRRLNGLSSDIEGLGEDEAFCTFRDLAIGNLNVAVTCGRDFLVGSSVQGDPCLSESGLPEQMAELISQSVVVLREGILRVRMALEIMVEMVEA